MPAHLCWEQNLTFSPQILTGYYLILKKGNSTYMLSFFCFSTQEMQGKETEIKIKPLTKSANDQDQEIKIMKSAKRAATLKTLLMTGFLFRGAIPYQIRSIFRHASVSSTYPCKLVGKLVGKLVSWLVSHTFGFPISGQ